MMNPPWRVRIVETSEAGKTVVTELPLRMRTVGVEAAGRTVVLKPPSRVRIVEAA